MSGNESNERFLQQPTWTAERTVQLIREYEALSVLWNPDYRGYLNRNDRNRAWAVLANNMELNVPEVRKKLNSLIAVFKAQHRKGIEKPRWWTVYMNFLHNIGKVSVDTQQKPNDIFPTSESDQCDNKALSDDDDENDDDDDYEEDDGDDCEFISEIPRKRCYLSAFEEFRDEFAPAKRSTIVNDSSNNDAITRIVEDHDNNNNDSSDIITLNELEKESVINDADSSDDMAPFIRNLECKMKGYKPDTRHIMQFHINRLLYQADLGLLDKQSITK